MKFVLVHAAVGVEEVDDRARAVRARSSGVRVRGEVEALEAAPAEHVEDQHAVVGDHGPAGFADDRGVLDARLVADFLDVEDDVVGVFLKAVVDAGAEVGLGAVVVDAEAAADVDVLEARAEALQFGVDADQLDDGVLDVADVVDLAAEVEVEQVEAVAHAVVAEVFQGVDDFADEQAELGAHAAGLFPAAGALGGELHAHADARA